MVDLKKLGKSELAERLSTSLDQLTDSKQKSEMQYLTHNLQTHQIELEMQNRELREAQIELEASRNRYADLYDFAPVGYVTLNTKGVITEINLTAARMLGLERANIINQPMTRWLEPESRTAFLNHLRLVFDKKGRAVAELKIMGQGHGTTQNVQFESTAVPGDESQSFCHAAMIDITERKQAENEKINLQRELQQSQKLEALGKLTGGIAHDFNNMLTIILMFSKLLKSSLSEQPKLYKYANEIQHAGNRSAKLTEKLLTFSQQKTPEAKSISINELLQKQKHMLEKTLTVRIKLVLNLQENLWQVWLDEGGMEDIIVNMSINAMHAIKDNGQLTIETSNQKLNQIDAQSLGIKPDDYVLLSFTDTGCGIAKEIRENIFDPFFTTKGTEGTGLGLSMAYGFVQNSGGAIKVYSEQGEGTQFTLYFPHYNGATRDQLPEKENYPEESIIGNKTILLVDDEPVILKLNHEILNSHGFKVICAESAKEALNILEHESIDILVSDVIMPEMDGYQLAAIVKEKYPAIKIQLASGFTDKRNMSIADECLQQDLLHKPFDSEDLLQRIRALCDEH